MRIGSVGVLAIGRSFSTTAQRPFFFNRPKPDGPSSLLTSLLAARKDGRLDVVTRLYPRFIDALKEEPIPVDPKQFAGIMRFIAGTKRFNLLLKMFADLSVVGYEATSYEHHIMLLGMSSMGKVEKALKWIEGMEATYGIVPSVADWNVVVEGYRKAQDLDGAEYVVRLMETRGKSPDVVTFNTLLSTLFETGRREMIDSVLERMRTSGVAANVWTETALLNGFTSARDLPRAQLARDRLLRLLDDTSQHTTRDMAAFNAVIKFESLRNGFLAATLLAEEYRDRGYELDAWTMNTLAREGVIGLSSAEEGRNFIEELERVTGRQADRFTWTIVISALLSNATDGGSVQAVKLYQEARSRSISPDSLMIQPLLSSLLLPHSSRDSLETAKMLYEDLAAASKDYRTAPDLSIYVTLLRACADDAVRDLEFSRTLLRDMQERGMKLEPITVTYHIISLMKAATSYDDAFKSYDIARALDVSALDTAAYNTLLAAFISLDYSTTDSPSAPAAMVMEFLSDMRRSANPPNIATYSTLLNYYTNFAGEASVASSTIAHIHSLIKLDINIDPDTGLFNSLMNAYSRVGAYRTAFRIWDSMVANRYIEIDQITISIYFDTCGFEGSEEGKKRATKLWDELRSEKKSRIATTMNLKNYESYVEALCRFGNLDEAERVVFADMRKGGKVEAELSTVETLLKFSRVEKKRWEKVRDRVRREREDLWDGVKDVAVWTSSGKSPVE